MLRILAVNDNQDVLGLIRHAAEAAGHAVETTTTGAQFKAAFARFRPNVVIIDLRLPDLAGTEIVRWLSDADTPPRVILVSGEPAQAQGDVAAELASRPGSDMSLLPTPFRIAELLDVLGRNQDRSDAD